MSTQLALGIVLGVAFGAAVTNLDRLPFPTGNPISTAELEEIHARADADQAWLESDEVILRIGEQKAVLAFAENVRARIGPRSENIAGHRALDRYCTDMYEPSEPEYLYDHFAYFSASGNQLTRCVEAVENVAHSAHVSYDEAFAVKILDDMRRYRNFGMGE